MYMASSDWLALTSQRQTGRGSGTLLDCAVFCWTLAISWQLLMRACVCTRVLLPRNCTARLAHPPVGHCDRNANPVSQRIAAVALSVMWRSPAVMRIT